MKYLLLIAAYFKTLLFLTHAKEVHGEHLQQNQQLETSRQLQDELTSLQAWLDNFVKSKNQIIGITTFLAAGRSSSSNPPIYTLSSGKAILSSAWDATNKKGIASTPVNMSGSTTCMLASTSKLLTWTALSMMLDAGKFDLEDDINDVLPFSVRNSRYPSEKVTYRHLYAHTSGILDSWDGYFYGGQCPIDPMNPYPKPLIETMKDGTDERSEWYNSRPGAKYHYSNYGTAVAALLVEQHSG